jgi:tetratricopeptide (TPR) repeat protein
MKFKTWYIYIIVVIAAAAVLVFVTSDQKTKQTTETQMPQDEIHKGLKDQTGKSPGKGNVSQEAIHQMEMLKKAAEENPDDTLKLREYADFLAQAHQQDEAIKEYEKILKKDPKRTDILTSIAFIHYNKKEYKEAEEGLSKVLAIDKNHLQAKYNLGAIAANQGDFEKAKKIWTQLVKEHPGTEMAKLAQESLSRL